MDAPIEHIAQALREQLAPLDAEAVRLKAALTDVKDKRDRIEAALAALGGGSKAKPQRAAISGPTKRQVTRVAEELVRDNGPLAPDDLGDLVKERLVADGGGASPCGSKRPWRPRRCGGPRTASWLWPADRRQSPKAPPAKRAHERYRLAGITPGTGRVIHA